MALKNSWAIHHPSSTTWMLGANETIATPTVPPTTPMTIHGRRMPSRDVVRSLIRPKNGLPNIATKAPMPATSARLPGACLMPTSAADLQRKGHQYRRLEDQVGAHERQGEEGDEPPSNPCRGRPAAQCSLGRQFVGEVGHRAAVWSFARTTSYCGRHPHLLQARGAIKTAICERELTPSLSMMCRM